MAMASERASMQLLQSYCFELDEDWDKRSNVCSADSSDVSLQFFQFNPKHSNLQARTSPNDVEYVKALFQVLQGGTGKTETFMMLDFDTDISRDEFRGVASFNANALKKLSEGLNEPTMTVFGQAAWGSSTLVNKEPYNFSATCRYTDGEAVGEREFLPRFLYAEEKCGNTAYSLDEICNWPDKDGKRLRIKLDVLLEWSVSGYSPEKLANNLFADASTADTTIIGTDGLGVKFHSVLMKLYCTNFKETVDLFSVNQDKKNPELHLATIDKNGLNILKKFIYGLETNLDGINCDIAIALFHVSRQLSIPELQKCLRNMFLIKPMGWFTDDNLTKLCDAMYLLPNIELLKERLVVLSLTKLVLSSK